MKLGGCAGRKELDDVNNLLKYYVPMKYFKDFEEEFENTIKRAEYGIALDEL